MGRFFTLIALLLALALPRLALAEPTDINAAARGVVRVVIVGTDGERIYPVSHGTGFAVTSDMIVTNAHVVLEAVQDPSLQIGIVPSGGGEAVYGALVAVSPQSDLALIKLTGDLRLPPLALAGGEPPEAGTVAAVGYPMNVDRAQGLEIGDIFSSQPPVKSRGFISGARPSRQFDTVLHTAPIARGNSGGPLLDECGRVIGVNSFGADNEGGDAEFFFAVSNRELMPFLRANDVTARINNQPCRSMAELNEAERDRVEQEQREALAALEQRSDVTREERARVQLEAEQGVLMEREDRMALAFVLLLIGFGLGQWALTLRSSAELVEEDDESEGMSDERKFKIVAAAAAFCGLAAIALYLTRPGLDDIDRRVNAAMQEGEEEAGSDGDAASGTAMALQCTLVTDRSRITSAKAEDISFQWTAGGCVNERTQYGLSGGTWSRVFVPNEEDAVAVNSFDPETRMFRTERYLLDRSDMAEAREARSKFTAPQCGEPGAAARLGEMQSEVLGGLPGQPNERLVYECSVQR